MLPFAYRHPLCEVKEGGTFFTGELEAAQSSFLGWMTRNQTGEGRRRSGDRKEIRTFERAGEMVAQEVVRPVQEIHLVELALLMELAHPVEMIPPVVVVTEAAFIVSNTVVLLPGGLARLTSCLHG